jgi:hypothetical protein
MWLFKYLYGVYVNYIHGVLLQVVSCGDMFTCWHKASRSLPDRWLTCHLQKINMRKLGELDTVVGPVKGLTVIVTGPTA